MSVSGSFRRSGSMASQRNNFGLLLLSFILCVTTVCAIIAVSRVTSKHHHLTASHELLHSTCSSARFPQLCVDAIITNPTLVTSLRTRKDVIEATLNMTITGVQHAYFNITKSVAGEKLTEREKIAVHDCLENIDETLEELQKTLCDTKSYNPRKPIFQQAEELKILLSAAMTNQRSCMDGFSHDVRDKNVSRTFSESLDHVHNMCSNALAMICNMTDKDMAMEKMTAVNEGRRLLSERELNGYQFPNWLPAVDRRILQERTVRPNAVVAADGSGEYRTVYEAVVAAPNKSKTRWVIRIKAGIYRENVEVPKKKTNIMFVGDGRTTTIITGKRNVVDGSTTFRSATVAVVGAGFLARDITFENTAGPSKHQAVALRVGSDLSAFYRCDIIGYQDTLYVHSLRQFYRSCIIIGTVDFIFGNAAAVFQDCDIHARRPNSGQKNMVTAHGREDPNQNTAIVIQRCRIGATADLQASVRSFQTYLGRPWKEYSRTVVMSSTISNIIDVHGWSPWSGDFALDTLYYAEYKNSGPGADTSNRVKWKGYKVITSLREAQQFSAKNMIVGDSWLSSTGFPFVLSI